MAQATIAVRPMSGPRFGKGVQAAKRMGGKFDGQVWHIPTDRPEIRILGTYSLVLVRADACTHYTTDQGCPMHGESCATWGQS